MPAKLDRCVQQVGRQGKVDNPFAVCNAAIRRKPEGSGTFTDAEIKRGYRHLETPTLKDGQRPVAFPGVPMKKGRM